MNYRTRRMKPAFIQWMRACVGIVCLLLLCTACADKGTQPGTATDTTDYPQNGSASTAKPAPGGSAIPQTGNIIDTGNVVPPADARYSVLCQTFRGSGNVLESRRAKEIAIKMTGRRDWYLVHSGDSSALYFGYYSTFDDPNKADFRRAQQDLRMLQEMKGGTGGPLFATVFFVEMATGDPPAPPEWNLVNAKGYWSLQIAAYRDSTSRKQAAVDAVKEARASGIEAYYYHGDQVSSVCIGAWQRSAVKEPQTVVNNDRHKDVIVATPGTPESVLKNARAREQNGEAVVLDSNYEAVDTGLKLMMQKYPNHYINGELYQSKVNNPQTHRMEIVPDPSFLVVIPHAPIAPVVVPSTVVDQRQTPADVPTQNARQEIYGASPATPANTHKQPGQLKGLGDD